MVQKKHFLKIKYQLLKFVFGGVLTCFCLRLPKRDSVERKEKKPPSQFPREHSWPVRLRLSLLQACSACDYQHFSFPIFEETIHRDRQQNCSQDSPLHTRTDYSKINVYVSLGGLLLFSQKATKPIRCDCSEQWSPGQLLFL